jgi:hypothetical protein
MRIKFWGLILLLLFARACDFYSTSLWIFQENGLQNETNPLTQYLGFGWNGLILSNIALIALVIAGHYYYSFKYVPRKLTDKSSNIFDFTSELYFNEKGQFHKVFYAFPKDKKLIIAHFGYVLIRVLIIGSFLATFHNLCQFYSVPFYDTFKKIVGRPLFVIYGLIAFSFVYFQFRLLAREYAEQVN